MSGNVVKFYPANAADSPDAVLEQAVGEYSQVMLIGYDKAGQFEARMTNGITIAEANMLADLMKAILIEHMIGDME